MSSDNSSADIFCGPPIEGNCILASVRSSDSAREISNIFLVAHGSTAHVKVGSGPILKTAIGKVRIEQLLVTLRPFYMPQ